MKQLIITIFISLFLMTGVSYADKYYNEDGNEVNWYRDTMTEKDNINYFNFLINTKKIIKNIKSDSTIHFYKNTYNPKGHYVNAIVTLKGTVKFYNDTGEKIGSVFCNYFNDGMIFRDYVHHRTIYSNGQIDLLRGKKLSRITIYPDDTIRFYNEEYKKSRTVCPDGTIKFFDNEKKLIKTILPDGTISIPTTKN